MGADRYRPSRRVAELVRARDRRCRFPGCTVAAAFCDLDHVRPWPFGPTSDRNLLCLCRRHHRIKQRPGWTVRVTGDGVATWTDPTGRVRTTSPVDALAVTVLSGCSVGVPGDIGAPSPVLGASHVPSRARTVVPDGPHSHLEFALEHRGVGLPAVAPRRDPHRRRHRPEVVPPRANLVISRSGHWCPRGARRPAEWGDGWDRPPF